MATVTIAVSADVLATKEQRKLFGDFLRRSVHAARESRDDGAVLLPVVSTYDPTRDQYLVEAAWVR